MNTEASSCGGVLAAERRLPLESVRVWPLAERRSLSRLTDILISPDADVGPVAPVLESALDEAAEKIRAARSRGASVMLIYGAHLIKNGLMDVVIRLLEGGWVTHLATNGAGTIHDWELAYLGRTEESVRAHVVEGCFGTWDETGRYLHLALMAGAVRGEGWGRSLGRFIVEDGVELPPVGELEAAIRREPRHPLAGARAELLQAMVRHGLGGGRVEVRHQYKEHSLLARAFLSGVPFTVHPGIGYDIIATHPWFNGAVLGRAGGWDFAAFGASVDRLDGGVVLSVGSAIMGPQVFEKSLSCVNNLRRQSGRPRVEGHTIFVVDLQDGGGWDWSKGEPPKEHPAYYLRFCKSYVRMGGTMRYVQCDNRVFLLSLWRRLRAWSDGAGHSGSAGVGGKEACA
ncbi:hypothetical protein [Limisphaera ngatamarikiensis]|uniref:hypothetical protein n=1 Tax=Limisphaera ngatamarikiensis TaxID=1324935 RepID=UPI0019804C98|nr:hypothetical protein [Limisphaera ngatamarikiensis]